MQVVSSSGEVDNLIRDIFGSRYYEHNQSILPVKEAELYQAACFSEMINAGLRRGSTSKTILGIIETLNHALENHIPLGKEVVLYRGVDKKHLVPEEGEFTDKAFNSVTLNPKVAKHFGDTILRITFRPEDKLLFFGGPKFYPETLEFITCPNITYKILGKSACGKYLEATPSGKQKAIAKPVITSFDEIYTRVVDSLKEKVTASNWAYIFYSKVKHVDAYRHFDIPNLYLPGEELLVGPNYNLYEDLYMKHIARVVISKRQSNGLPEESEMEDIPFLL